MPPSSANREGDSDEVAAVERKKVSTTLTVSCTGMSSQAMWASSSSLIGVFLLGAVSMRVCSGTRSTSSGGHAEDEGSASRSGRIAFFWAAG